MRILSISGQNIASLSAPFTIDFTAPPLLGAGLFAITGETGAGKSSILDAMCLALYGDAPRLAAGSSGDEVPDAGDPIKARDARTMLRRGAIQGWAEVRFTAIDGQDYTAHWQARRARDKADGKLQSVARKLARASDGQILASQTGAVTEQITALTGLSYDEFRRTVLLAQGDFDAFLRADTNERAGLLEKITGTGLYRAVSQRIYERTEVARQAHDTLALRRDAHHLLSPEDRGALEMERSALITAQDAAMGERKALAEGVDHHRRHRQAAVQLTLAERVEGAALAAVMAAAPDRAELALLETAEPLRALWQAVHDCTRRAEDTGLALQHADIVRQEAAREAARQGALRDIAESAFKAKEAEFKRLGPLWTAAADLDSQIQSASAEADSAAMQAHATADFAMAAQTALTALRAEEQAALKAQAAADGTLTALEAAFPLADRWDQTQRDIAGHAEADQAQKGAETLAKTLEAALAALSLRLEVLDEKAHAGRAHEGALTTATVDLSRQIARLEADHPPAKSAVLSGLTMALGDMARARRDHDAASTDRAAATRTGAAAGVDITVATVATVAISAAAEALSRAEAQITALTSPLAQADLALSDIAQSLRLHLEEGVPCPVCGSCEHPVHADAALAALAETLRRDIGAARARANSARAGQTLAQGQFAAAQARMAEAGSAAQAAKARSDGARQAWEAARAVAVSSPLCPDLPVQPGADVVMLEGAVTNIAALQQTEAVALSALADLRKRLGDTTATREALRQTMAARGTDRETLTKGQAADQQRLALAQQDIRSQSATMAKLKATLRPLISGAGEVPEALGRDPQLRVRLGALVGRITDARGLAKGATEALATLAPRIATAVSQAETTADQAMRALDMQTKRAGTLTSLQAQRALMLGGEATTPHRTRFNDGRKLASDTLARCNTDHTAAAGQAATALARHEACLANDAAAQRARATAAATLEAAMATAQLPAEMLAALFVQPRDRTATLRQSLRTLDDAVTGARTARAARLADRDAIAAEALPEESEDALTAALASLDTDTAQRGQRIGAIQGDMARDDLTRQSLIGLEAEIAKARAEHEVWQAVNNAVGSRNGDRFARVAQSITLDVMVDHANHHLANLNPRYRLRRAEGLALQVEDRDMGGEARATRSLSGGERFLVSLALALALSRMGGKGGLAATLFIDEGFGSLDPASLDLAIDALESLQSQGRQVGVISHVEAMKDRIPVRIAVRKQGGGKSVVEVTGVLL